MDVPKTKDALLHQIRHKLGQGPLDFPEMRHVINAAKGSGKYHGAAGILLLLYNRPKVNPSNETSHEMVLQLIKRSNRVSQGGDISCPGGMLNPLADRGLAFLTYSGIIPAFRGLPRDYARKRPAESYRLINLFLANGLRESWEEIRLNPFNVEFLGPLPTHSLILFRRTIFPLVAYVKKPWVFQPNQEVDRMIEIPLKDFFDETNYANFSVEAPASGDTTSVIPRQFPCFVFEESSGHQEILWGATFNIIMNFLNVAFNFSMPDISSRPQFKRILTSRYIAGRREDSADK
jgi:8-oxo-dGTP pyrophosphatase MutT (NUDIX family)